MIEHSVFAAMGDYKRVTRSEWRSLVARVSDIERKQGVTAHEVAYVIGGGPSLKGLSLESLGGRDTFAVNVAAFDVPQAKYAVTVDYTFLRKVAARRKSFEQLSATKVFVADMHWPYMQEKNGGIVDTRSDMRYDLSAFDVVVKARYADGIGYTFKDFATGLNSGYCAMQLAVILGYKRVYLLGIDLGAAGSVTHYHRAYPHVQPNKFAEKLCQYAKYFRNGLRRLRAETAVEVINCSPASPLRAELPYVSYEEALS